MEDLLGNSNPSNSINFKFVFRSAEQSPLTVTAETGRSYQHVITSFLRLRLINCMKK